MEQITQYPPKLDSELTIQHLDGINVLEHSLPSDIRYVGSKENHIICLINRFCLHAVVTHMSYDHLQD